MNLSLKKCYLCGSDKDLTKDHIPPKNLFVSPLPDNLITVPCCKKCNESYVLDDEAFRVFVSAAINRSQSGQWIWKNKVVNGSFKRSAKLKENVRKSVIKIPYKNSGLLQYGISFPEKRATNYLIRLTKGLLASFYPELDYNKSKFSVEHLEPTQELINITLAKFIYNERGNGIFRFWHTFYEKNKVSSVWVYVFYDAFMFMVEVDPQ